MTLADVKLTEEVYKTEAQTAQSNFAHSNFFLKQKQKILKQVCTKQLSHELNQTVWQKCHL